MADRYAVDAAIVKGAEPIDLREEGSHGVLLLHGFGDTPQTLSLFAKHLSNAGLAVFVPLLPGHGRSMAEFNGSRADDWIRAAEDAYVDMRGRYRTISISGLSMGGALAVIIAGRHHDIASLVLFAPYLGMPRWLQAAARTHWLWGRIAGPISASSPLSIHDPVEREKNLAYGQVTGHAINELARVVGRARRALEIVEAPTLIIQSREDPRVSPAVAENALKRIAATEKQIVWTSGAGHIITVDYGRERLFGEAERWLVSHAGRNATAARSS
ncbi:MAG TPA: alpha/beta fold hydrolase [Gemmatimonadaceae bacterium]|jgi:carboxylesterase|nr:alpha/beta fold hydrolase [Gemmatimonadaceae bacterium]